MNTPVVSSFLETAFQLTITVYFCLAVSGSLGSVVGWLGVANLPISQPMSSRSVSFLPGNKEAPTHERPGAIATFPLPIYSQVSSLLYQASLIFDRWIDTPRKWIRPKKNGPSSFNQAVTKQLLPTLDPLVRSNHSRSKLFTEFVFKGPRGGRGSDFSIVVLITQSCARLPLSE